MGLEAMVFSMGRCEILDRKFSAGRFSMTGPTFADTTQQGPIYLSDADLAIYDGTDPKRPIYVGLNGSIYDVSASPHTYGPGGSYHFFAGRDAARAFLTGCFAADLTPDLRGVEEMFIPIDSPDEPPLSSKELKIRNERDLRVARKKIKEGIDGWAKVFRGETGRPYFYVGQIKRDPDFWEKLPRRELCQQAIDSRPKREKDGEE
jgi:predicted heme/steroid binding protein